jgi:UDP-3-O-[3-hydroxymyristoyl] N-acetylglucosamine deacetylase / 3-hydroxyacyl-[acyl-carrier-protein] dehydratase
MYYAKQHTIKKAVSVSGVGLHTGVPANMTFLPAAANHGIVFQRIDIVGQPTVPADVDFVVDVSRGTTIAKGEARINTVEHTLAALMGLQIDNVLIQLDGPEPPIMDGSSQAFIEALQEAGLSEQNAIREFVEITQSLSYEEKARKVEISALPSNDYRLTVMVDYNSQVLGSQHAHLFDIRHFAADIAKCRTFCFLHEVEMLYKNNLIKGGALNNAIVIVDRLVEDKELEYLSGVFNVPKVEVKKEGILNNLELHYANEPARHKLLDLVGDLALVGKPIKGQIFAVRPGHAANVAFAKKIKREAEKAAKVDKVPTYDPSKAAIYDINQISRLLPHRYPFLLIDKITHLDSVSVEGIKNVSINEPFFQGHFPGNPVMPGVLQIEAMAQTGGILVLSTLEKPDDYWAYFVGIENCRFRKMVIPGDTIVFRCDLIGEIRRGLAKIERKSLRRRKIGLRSNDAGQSCEKKPTAIFVIRIILACFANYTRLETHL